MLSELCRRVDGAALEFKGGIAFDYDVAHVTHDSRDVVPGTLFVALPGQRADGLQFLPQALARGARIIAVPRDTAIDLPADVGCLHLVEPRRDLASLSAFACGQPSRRLSICGVTGTNGKTTVTTIIADCVAASGEPPGLIGTVSHRIGERVVPTRHTTPEAPELQRLLGEMVDAGVLRVAMEVSSIGLVEHRVDETRFLVAAFTNLTPDHLDYHLTMQDYGEAKTRLFSEHLDPTGTALIDVDDPFGQALCSKVGDGVRVWRVSLVRRDVEVYYETLSQDARGLRGTLCTPLGALQLETPLIGRFNASNVAIAAASAWALGVPPEAVARALLTATVRGRLERVPGPSTAPTVLVDYAHTPDALSRVLEALASVSKGRVICIFGCGGDRDVKKRPQMGEAAAVADAVIVTTDNPRSESPEAIALAAAAGSIAGGRPLSALPAFGFTTVILDRSLAITAALTLATANDVVLVAGKGHETYQEVQGVRLDFDDVKVSADALVAWRGDETCR